MPSAEQRALLALLALAVAGQLVRHLLTQPGDAPGQVQLLATLTPGSPLAQRDSAMRQGRPLEPGERIDVDNASAAELTRLPKVGPRLAKVILANREEHGPFGSVAGLDRVPGIGPALLKSIEPHVIFSGKAGQRVSAAMISDAKILSCDRQAANPPRCQPAPLNINTATASELDALPGIGPAKAAAILRYREEHGAFTGTEDLALVPGFGPALVSNLESRISVR
ncbi:MAG TPA: ComEA family DNA-binding protein [Gemmatimonadales bacterium]|nr:ComEA family DNA-binding protein [Gemmatimonadales bacterium]